MAMLNGLAGVLALLLVQTAAAPVTAQTPADSLTSKAWTVSWIKDAADKTAEGAELKFGEAGRLSGFGGCNRLMASYTLDENTGALEISAVASTRKLCAGKIMAFEKSFIKLLKDAATAEIDTAGVVTLNDKAGEPLVVLN